LLNKINAIGKVISMGIILNDKLIPEPYSIYIPDKTFEDLLEYTNEDIACELLDGVLVIHSPASYLHESIFGFLFTLLKLYGSNHALGKPIGSRFMMKLTPDWAPEPDIMFLTGEDQDRLQDTYLSGPASVVIEILSKATRKDDIEKKTPQYLESGVREVWLIDPENKNIELFWPDLEPIIYIKGWVLSKVIQNFKIQIDWIWNPNSITELDALQEIESDYI
jgi:Uma2 family endonuclease